MCKISLFVSTFELWKIWYALLPKESMVATAILPVRNGRKKKPILSLNGKNYKEQLKNTPI
jgi:hypothetical protein